MGKDGVDKETVFNNYQSIRSRTFAVSLVVEFVGVALFAFLGSTVTDKILGPFVNGFALAVWIYTAANISGGHLNPAVTFSVTACGFYPVLHALLYIALQVAGGICGSLLAAGLMPGASINMGDKGPGCFVPGPGIDNGKLFGWEILMTFTLISCVYACGVAKPGHGSHTPLAVGLALLACAGTGAAHTGASLNPARSIGPLVVFGCGKDYTWVYIVAQIAAAVSACLIFSFVSGWGPLMPLKAQRSLGLTMPEAFMLFVTGQPPARFQTARDDNITDVLSHVKGHKSLLDKLKLGGDVKDDKEVMDEAKAAEELNL